MESQSIRVSPRKERSRRRKLKIGKRLLRKLEAFQGRHSAVGDPPVFDNDIFPWVPGLEAATAEVREELDRLLQHPEDIPAFHQMSPDQGRISKGQNWKTYAFYVFGERVDENCAACPHTAALLDDMPTLVNAWFSILAPRYHIPPHRGPTRAVIRAHLPLIVPSDCENCWIRVHDRIHRWTVGRCFVFDDTYEHEVRNDTDEQRVVLFLDFDRPMDAIGNCVNRAVKSLIRLSPYVRDPLKNLAEWNQNHRNRSN